MTQRSSPGLGQWLLVTFLIAGISFMLFKLYQYGAVRQNFPAGLEVAGLDVGGYNRQEVEELLSNRYLAAPVVVYHGQDAIEINPTQVKFTLDFETMLSRAQFERDQQDYWAGFWGYLWNRPVEVEPVELIATHDAIALQDILQAIADQMDSPPQAALPEISTLSFKAGAPGNVTNITASLADVTAALYRPRNRTATLVVESQIAPQPERNLLENMLTNRLQEFEASSGGIASIFLMNLADGTELAYNANLPMSGMELLKIPLALQALRTLDLDSPQAELVRNTLTETGEAFNANELLGIIDGAGDAVRGATLVNAFVQGLGLTNTYFNCPYEQTDGRCRQVENPEVNGRTDPDPYRQTTAEDMGTLLAMLYYCAEQGGGALIAVYSPDLTQSKCQAVLAALETNRIDSLIEEGVPDSVLVAHRHAWQNDTYADAGIVFSPGGDYVLVEIMHKPGWLAWTVSSPVMADLSQATYNFFNFAAPYLNTAR